MPFFLYGVSPTKNGFFEYLKLGKISLAGNKSGLIYPFVKRLFERKELRKNTLRWHIGEDDILNEAQVSPDNHAIVIDLKPKTQGNVSLYELKDIWGYTYPAWTPIAFRLETLFVDREEAEPHTFKNKFSDETCEREEVHEFLYLQGGWDSGNWVWGRAGAVNGALLWPDALEFFIRSFRKSPGDKDA